MAQPFLLIDGYNLMHAAGMARLSYGPGDLERCRIRFLKFLSGRLASAERSRTTIVFDAADAPPHVSRYAVLDGMQIVFAPPGGDADTLIEELIAAHSAPRQVRLVSSDHRLQKAARRRRAAFIDSESFHVQLERRGAVAERSDRQSDSLQRAHPKFTGRVSARETEEWLELFGEIPEAAELNAPDELDQWQAWLDQLPDDPDDWPEEPPRNR